MEPNWKSFFDAYCTCTCIIIHVANKASNAYIARHGKYRARRDALVFGHVDFMCMHALLPTDRGVLV